MASLHAMEDHASTATIERRGQHNQTERDSNSQVGEAKSATEAKTKGGLERRPVRRGDRGWSRQGPHPAPEAPRAARLPVGWGEPSPILWLP